MAVGWAMLIAGVAQAAYGAYQSNQTSKENEALANQSVEDEMARRENVQAAIEEMFGQYNALREERPGLTIEEYIGDRLKVLNNPELKAAFRNLTREDFAEAQYLADQATQGNVETFNKAVNAISDGYYQKAIKGRNDLAESTNSEEAYKRAMELASPMMPAGSFEEQTQDASQLQRGNKFAFQTAYEVDQGQRQLKWDRLNSIINDDRNLALRQQERASTFMPMTSFVNYATDLHLNQRKDQLAMQLSDESFMQSLIGGLMGQAYTNQTASPSFRDTSVYDKMIAEGIGSAVKSGSQIYADSNKNNKKTGTTGGLGTSAG